MKSSAAEPTTGAFAIAGRSPAEDHAPGDPASRSAAGSKAQASSAAQATASSEVATSAEFALRRSQIYHLLSTIFGREPNQELLARLSTPEIAAGLSDSDIQYQDELWRRPAAERLTELEVEYARLFIGPGPHIALQESVQRGEGQLWGEFTCSAVQWYARAAFQVSPAWKDLPDHLAVELAFLGFLAEREAICWRRLRFEQAMAHATLQREFLKEHPLQWMPQVAHQVAERAHWAFYRAFATLLDRLLASEHASIDPVPSSAARQSASRSTGD